MEDKILDPISLYDTDVSRTIAVEIARRFFGGCVPTLEVTRNAYLLEIGSVRLRVMRSITVPGFVHCGVEVLQKRVGYFNFDLKTLEISPLWKDD